jgi:hypothetical protein
MVREQFIKIINELIRGIFRKDVHATGSFTLEIILDIPVSQDNFQFVPSKVFDTKNITSVFHLTARIGN